MKSLCAIVRRHHLSTAAIAAVYLVFGLFLMIGGLLLSGAGEGSYIALVAFGSPLSWFAGGLAVPAVWGLIGAFLATGRRNTAKWWLLIHFVAIPFGIQSTLRSADWWAEIDLALTGLREAPEFWAFWVVYMVGCRISWCLVSHPVTEGDDELRTPS